MQLFVFSQKLLTIKHCTHNARFYCISTNLSKAVKLSFPWLNLHSNWHLKVFKVKFHLFGQEGHFFLPSGITWCIIKTLGNYLRTTNKKHFSYEALFSSWWEALYSIITKHINEQIIDNHDSNLLHLYNNKTSFLQEFNTKYYKLISHGVWSQCINYNKCLVCFFMSLVKKSL